jgi:aminoglycoside 6'-N-acetyltransferase I
LKSRRGLEIRAASGADAPGLCELLSSAGHVMSPRALAERLDAVRQASGTVLLAVEWGPPSGLIALHWYPTIEADQPLAQITTLLVGPGERRRGIGRLLVKAASQAARIAGCGTLQVLAAPEQPALQDFCKATGFTGAGACFVRPLRKNGPGL